MHRRPASRQARWAGALLVAVCLYGVAVEIPYHLTPRVKPNSPAVLTIFGDSITAGVGDREIDTWPRLLQRVCALDALDVHDHSEPGATVATMLRKVRSVPIADGIVIVEIGGNDLLGGHDVEKFAAGLDALLEVVSQPGRQVVLFELPLPPFANGYGRAQRQLAWRHQAILLPKRVLMKVLTVEGATLDSLHLSPNGHRLLADAIARVLEPAMRNGHRPTQ